MLRVVERGCRAADGEPEAVRPRAGVGERERAAGQGLAALDRARKVDEQRAAVEVGGEGGEDLLGLGAEAKADVQLYQRPQHVRVGRVELAEEAPGTLDDLLIGGARVCPAPEGEFLVGAAGGRHLRLALGPRDGGPVAVEDRGGEHLVAFEQVCQRAELNRLARTERQRHHRRRAGVGPHRGARGLRGCTGGDFGRRFGDALRRARVWGHGSRPNGNLRGGLGAGQLDQALPGGALNLSDQDVLGGVDRHALAYRAGCGGLGFGLDRGLRRRFGNNDGRRGITVAYVEGEPAAVDEDRADPAVAAQRHRHARAVGLDPGLDRLDAGPWDQPEDVVGAERDLLAREKDRDAAGREFQRPFGRGVHLHHDARETFVLAALDRTAVGKGGGGGHERRQGDGRGADHAARLCREARSALSSSL